MKRKRVWYQAALRELDWLSGTVTEVLISLCLWDFILFNLEVRSHVWNKNCWINRCQNIFTSLLCYAFSPPHKFTVSLPAPTPEASFQQRDEHWWYAGKHRCFGVNLICSRKESSKHARAQTQTHVHEFLLTRIIHVAPQLPDLREWRCCDAVQFATRSSNFLYRFTA